MRIRPALPEDAEALAALGERLWRESYTGLIPAENLERHLAATFGPGRQARELADPRCRTLLLAVEDQPLAYTLLTARAPDPAFPQPPFARPLEITRFYVDARLHGQGAAPALMEAAFAAAAGHDGLWLQTWEKNARALRFYARMGFRDLGEATFRVGGQVDRDRLLARPLF